MNRTARLAKKKKTTAPAIPATRYIAPAAWLEADRNPDTSRWRDLSGNNNHGDTVGSPSLGLINGRPAYQGNGSNIGYTLPQLISGTQDHLVTIVVRSISNPTSLIAIAGQYRVGQSGRYLLLFTTDSGGVIFSTGFEGQFTNPGAAADTSPHVFSVRKVGNQYEHWRDGVLVASNSTSDSILSTSFLLFHGRDSGDSNAFWYNGLVGAFSAFIGTATDGQLLTEHYRMAIKYGIELDESFILLSAPKQALSNSEIIFRTLGTGGAEAVTRLRSLIISSLWSGSGLPSNGINGTSTGVSDPLATHSLSPSNLLRVDQVTVELRNNNNILRDTLNPYVWYPTSGTSNNRFVMVAVGHSDDDSVLGPIGLGYGELIRDLVEDGYTVANIYMPFGADPAQHNALPDPTADENYLRYFVETPIRLINEFTSFSAYFMAGKSGGGMVTTLTTAIETRISRSADVAGSFPLATHVPGRDFEQYLPGIRDLVDFGDLYLMAASGRSHLHAYNTQDSCCFTQAQRDTFPTFDWVPLVQSRATELNGVYTLEINSSTLHEISAITRANIISLFSEV